MRHAPGSFPTIRLSRDAHTMLRELEQAAMSVEAAQDREETENAYARLTVCRKAFAEYLHKLERKVGTFPSVTLRF